MQFAWIVAIWQENIFLLYVIDFFEALFSLNKVKQDIIFFRLSIYSIKKSKSSLVLLLLMNITLTHSETVISYSFFLMSSVIL